LEGKDKEGLGGNAFCKEPGIRRHQAVMNIKMMTARHTPTEEAANDGLLGPTPINLESLKANPEVYLRFSHTFLHEMEIARPGTGAAKLWISVTNDG
jgi:hypothetical protein